MTADQRLPILPKEEWLVESLRATIFPVPGAVPSADAWWLETIGADPETRTIRPATHEQQEEGPFEDGRLTLTVNALGIVQWQVAPSPPAEFPSAIPSAGTLATILPRFMETLGRWLPMSPVANRLAIGAVVFVPVLGHRQGYERLGAYLRNYVKLDPESSSEFLYRINRPRASTTSIQGLRINRLSTWAVLKMTLMGIAGGGIQGKVGDELYACRVELDINTAPTFDGTFDHTAIAEVTQELQGLALEILAEGDVP